MLSFEVNKDVYQCFGNCLILAHRWLGSVMHRMLDLRSRGRWFDFLSSD